ncbi:MAG: CHAP domain-containing protein [Clostridiales bacterium]|nr:CHAP domain-containing protein [Clostridiales bacterium]
MKKRVISMFLCLCMAFTLVSTMVPTARAITVDAFIDKHGAYITENNPYYRESNKGTQEFNGVRTWQCTAYVWQRVYELHHIELSKLRWGNAKEWLSKAKDAGYEIGKTPKLNSIVVYDGVVYDGVEYGHVAYVEDVSVSADGKTITAITVSEGGRTQYQGTGGIATEKTTAINEGDVRWYYKNGKDSTVLGYIYLPVDVDPPAAPTNITGEWTSTGPDWSARISWTAGSGATRYEVQYRTPKTRNEWKSDPDYKSGTSYISTRLKDYSYYEYRIRACNAGGASDWVYYTLHKTTAQTTPSTQGISKPAKPKNVFASWTLSGKMTARVSWPAVSGAEYYNVQYKKANESFWCSTSPVRSGTSYTFPELGADASWDFRVEAVNAGGSSGWTECSLPAQKNIISTILKPPSVVATPTGVAAKWKSAGSNASAELTWNTVSNVDHYEVGYKKAGGSWVTISSCIFNTSTSYIFYNLDSSSSYSFRIKAVKSDVSSAWAEYTLARSEPTELANPSGVSGVWTSTGSKWQARISWNAVSGATHYEVQYRTPTTGNEWRTDKDYSSGTSYISTGLGSYNSYDYRVRAVNANGVSGWTEYTLVKSAPTTEPTPSQTTSTPPSAPSGVSGVWTSTGSKWQARISWNAVSGATRYEVQYRTPTTGNEWRTDSDYSSGTSYISTGLGNYNSYDYRVRAVNASGASSWTEYTLFKTVSTLEPTPSQATSLPSPTEVTPTPPAAPSGVSGEWTSTGSKWQARISWNAVSGATRYEVQYRTPTTGNAWRTDSDYSSGTSYISTGLGNYNSYDYRVRAVNANGASEWTEYTLVKTASTSAPTATAPAAPTNVSGTWTSRGPNWQARISWTPVSGATRYEVQYRTPRTGNEWRTDSDYSSGTSYISTGLGSYNSYDYRVRAVNANGASEWTEYTLYK